MGLQGLALRNVARIEAATGLYVVRGTANGGRHWYFTSCRDEHGWYDPLTGAWALDVVPDHTTMCRTLFGDLSDLPAWWVVCPDGQRRVRQEGSRMPEVWPICLTADRRRR